MAASTPYSYKTKLYLPFKIVRITNDLVDVPEREWILPEWKMAAKGEIIIDYQVTSYWPTPEWKSIDSFTLPEGTEIKPTANDLKRTEQSFKAATYQVHISLGQISTTGSRYFSAVWMEKPEYLSIKLIDDSAPIVDTPPAK